MLDELVNTIETLKARINDHRAALQKSEAQTRYSLVDPLLLALGWDTADPELVQPEYVVSRGRPDYALMDSRGEVVVFLEAKSLGEPLAGHRSQVTGYANELGIRYPALTNGSEWEVYDNFQPVPIEQRRILSISLAKEENNTETAIKLLLLWRPNMVSGQPIAASEPIVGLEETHTEAPAPAASPAPAKIPDSTVGTESGWVTLDELSPQRYAPHPQKVRFPNGEIREPTSWRALVVEVAEWLVRDGALTADRCPVLSGSRLDSAVVNMQPRHPAGTDIYSPHTLSNGLFLAAHGTSQELVRKSLSILTHLGYDPATVHVQVG